MVEKVAAGALIRSRIPTVAWTPDKISHPSKGLINGRCIGRHGQELWPLPVGGIAPWPFPAALAAAPIWLLRGLHINPLFILACQICGRWKRRRPQPRYRHGFQGSHGPAGMIGERGEEMLNGAHLLSPCLSLSPPHRPPASAPACQRGARLVNPLFIFACQDSGWWKRWRPEP